MNFVKSFEIAQLHKWYFHTVVDLAGYSFGSGDERKRRRKVEFCQSQNFWRFICDNLESCHLKIRSFYLSIYDAVVEWNKQTVNLRQVSITPPAIYDLTNDFSKLVFYKRIEAASRSTYKLYMRSSRRRRQSNYLNSIMNSNHAPFELVLLPKLLKRQKL
jgi:hypothetical protein